MFPHSRRWILLQLALFSSLHLSLFLLPFVVVVVAVVVILVVVVLLLFLLPFLILAPSHSVLFLNFNPSL